MTADVQTRRILRAVAIAIAIAAVVDPAVTSRRDAKPDVVVVAADSARDGAVANDVAERLGHSFTVARGALSGAAASVVVGRTLPDGVARDAPIFAISAADDRPSVALEKLVVPSTVPTLSRAQVAARIRVQHARGKTLDVTLRNATIAVDHVTRSVANDDDTLDVALTFIPPSADPAALRVVAHVDGAPDAIGDALADVVDRRWPVLFYDPRPSWMSTFVRRAIERDPRFVVTSRVVTSRDVTTAAGNPPGRLDDLAALSLFDAVVIGSPSALSANDAAGLDAFLRMRGGSVVLLLDDLTSGPHDRLIDAGRFSSTSGTQTVALRSSGLDSSGLRASTFAWPVALPIGGQVIAGGARPVVWSAPVGAGRLVVSGAFDAWRFRDPATSSFDRFWRTTIANAADATLAPVVLRASSTTAAAGERLDVTAWLRDEAVSSPLATPPAEVRVTVDDTTSPTRAWPRATGELQARVRVPQTPGLHRIGFDVGGRHADIPILVGRDLHQIEAGSEATLRDWSIASGGAVLSPSKLASLPDLLRRSIHAEARMVTWHPMRSAWWLVPFVVALSAEWWLRRRRGLL
jgi:hypothetical protein